jgi:hypothetical protein
MRGRGSRIATLAALAITSGVVVGAGACADVVRAAAASVADAGVLEDSSVEPAVDAESDSSVSAVPPIACDTMADATPPPGALAVGQGAPNAIAVDGTNVYWVNAGTGGGMARKSVIPSTGGQVMKCARPGCDGAPTVLAAGFTSLPFAPVPFAVGSAGLYFDDFSTGTVACGLDGCGDAGVLVSMTHAIRLAADATHVYSAGVDGLLEMTTAGDAGAAVLYSGNDWPRSVAVDATDAYFVTGNGIVMKCAIGGCNGTPTVVATGALVGVEIALDANNVYWTAVNGGPGTIFACPKAGCATPTTLVPDRLGLGSIATDGVALYFTELGNDSVDGLTVSGRGGVYKCAVGGCNGQPTAVAAYQTGPEGIAVDSADAGDAGRVYFTAGPCNGTLVLSVAK